MSELRALTDVIESWDMLKRDRKSFTQSDLRKFLEVHNAHTRKMIAMFRVTNPEFWVSLAELANNAATLTTPGAKVIADGIDRTGV